MLNLVKTTCYSLLLIPYQDQPSVLQRVKKLLQTFTLVFLWFNNPVVANKENLSDTGQSCEDSLTVGPFSTLFSCESLR